MYMTDHDKTLDLEVHKERTTLMDPDKGNRTSVGTVNSGYGKSLISKIAKEKAHSQEMRLTS